MTVSALATPEPQADETPVRLALHVGQVPVYCSPARFKVVVAGRRWGKTHLSRVMLVSRALSGPGRYWYVAPTFKDAKDIFWRDLKAAVDDSWLAERPNETELAIRLVTGSEIRLLGADHPDALRGRGLNFVVLDEFADMKPEAWTEALRPALSDHQAPALFIGTPKSYNHFHGLFERGQSGDPAWASWQARTVDNPFIDPLEVEEARGDLDERTWRQEYEASFETIAGRAYYAFERQHNVQSVELDRDAPVCVSFDFNIDPASAIIGQRQGDRAVVWREVQLSHRGGEATRACAVAARNLIVGERGTLGMCYVYGDATGRAAKTTGPADHAILREVFPGATWRIPKANPHQRDRVAAVNALCRNAEGVRRLVVDSSCRRLIADLEQVIYADNGELDKSSNPMLTHASDALGYWLAKDFPVKTPARAVAALTVPPDQRPGGVRRWR